MAKCKLTERIELEMLEEIQNENGFTQKNWTSIYKCWAKYRAINGSEFLSAKATNSENVVTFSVRYCKQTKKLLEANATKIFRIQFKGRAYNILYASDFEDSHEYIDIKCSVID